MFLGWGQCGGNEKWAWDRCRAILALHFQGWTHLKTSDSRGSASNFVFFPAQSNFLPAGKVNGLGECQRNQEQQQAEKRHVPFLLPIAPYSIIFFFLLFIY